MDVLFTGRELIPPAFFMKLLIPYIESKTEELKYCLRSIEKFIDNPQVIIIGDKPQWINNINHIPFKDAPGYKNKERNIFEKLSLVKEDFFYFNDDYFLLQPFHETTYHFSGTILQSLSTYHRNNECRGTLQNTFNLYGDIPSYYHHAPMFINHILFEDLKELDWSLDYGYCIKSIYCHNNGIEGVEYNDLKIRGPQHEKSILEMIDGRPYFSTDNGAVNTSMIKVLESLYPNKSKYENNYIPA